MAKIPYYAEVRGIDQSRLDTAPRTQPRVSRRGEVGKAIAGIGGQVSKIGLIAKEREEDKEDFETNTRYEEARAVYQTTYQDRADEMSETGDGFHQDQMNKYGDYWDAFLETVPERSQQEYANKIAKQSVQVSAQTASEEYAANNRYEVKSVGEIAVVAVDNIAQGGDLKENQARIKNALKLASLPAEVKAKIWDRAEKSSVSAKFVNDFRANPKQAMKEIGVTPADNKTTTFNFDKVSNDIYEVLDQQEREKLVMAMIPEYKAERAITRENEVLDIVGQVEDYSDAVTYDKASMDKISDGLQKSIFGSDTLSRADKRKLYDKAMDTVTTAKWVALFHENPVEAMKQIGIVSADNLDTEYTYGAPTNPIYDRFSAKELESMFKTNKAEYVNKQNNMRTAMKAEQSEQHADLVTKMSMNGASPSSPVSLEANQIAYGTVVGKKVYNEQQQSLRVAKVTHSMNTMPAAERAAEIARYNKIAATSNNADNKEALQVAVAASKANANITKSINNDPVTHLRTHNPAIDTLWNNANNPKSIKAAIDATADEQSRMGVPVASRRYLAAKLTAGMKELFADTEIDSGRKFNTVSNLYFATDDPTIRKGILEQMIEDGVPESMEASLIAQSRGDTASAKQLADFAMVDPKVKKSWDVVSDKSKATELKESVSAITSSDMARIYYGTDITNSENIQRASRDRTVMDTGIAAMVNGGMTFDDATVKMTKMIFGDVKVLDYTAAQGKINIVERGTIGRSRGTLPDISIKAVLPTGTDNEQFARGISALFPNLMADLDNAYPDQGHVDYARIVAKESVIHNGYIRNIGTGFGFYDAVSGTLVSRNGKPVVYSLEQIMGAGGIEDVE